MNLQELFDYKNQLMKDLLTNETIVKLIDEDATLETAKSLAYDVVFPAEYIPYTAEHGKVFICFDVDIQKSLNKTFLLPTIKIWVFSHSSKLRLPEGGIRVDALCSEIAKAINGSRYYGLGQLELESVARYAPLTDWVGKVMTFNATDFSKVYNPKASIPKNRRLGE